MLSAQLKVWVAEDAEQMVKQYLLDEASGIKVLSVNYRGHSLAFGRFVTEGAYIDIESGLILSTGYAETARGPNMSSRAGDQIGSRGDPELVRLANNITFDAASLNISFIPTHEFISFEFIFASEEYPEYVGKGVNDVFGFFLEHQASGNKKNLALIPGTGEPVTVDNVNRNKNSAYFMPNGYWTPNNVKRWEGNKIGGEYAYNFQYDGMTTWLKAESEVLPGEIYHLKIAIADAGDGIYDSAVMLKKGSMRSTPPPINARQAELLTLNELFKGEEIKRRGDSIVLTLHLNFESDQSSTSDAGDQAKLEHLRSLMTTHEQLGLRVEGYTDSSGDRDYNLRLSRERAQFAVDWLSQKGISNGRLKGVGFGQASPVASNLTEEGKALNRRVEFVFY